MDEVYLTLKEAAMWFKVPKTPVTIGRYIRRGLLDRRTGERIRLKHRQDGATILTTVRWLKEFDAVLNQEN